nr:hypothetical protein [Corynebacterium sp. MSK082]MDK8648272.1 hypothetical protein [Corynebacterium sp. MSK082]
MAKDFFAGLGDDTLPQVPGDTEQVAETDTVDEGFCGPALINEAVADLASYRERYSQLAQHVKGGSFHEPGSASCPLTLCTSCCVSTARCFPRSRGTSTWCGLSRTA